MADIVTQLLRAAGLVSSPRRKGGNSKMSRLRRKASMIKKLERKQASPKFQRNKALDAALAAADAKLMSLRGFKTTKAKK